LIDSEPSDVGMTVSSPLAGSAAVPSVQPVGVSEIGTAAPGSTVIARGAASPATITRGGCVAVSVTCF
jgi:hypothetical protein